MGPRHFWQRIFGIYFYHYGPESFEGTQRLLLEEKIKDASGQHAVAIHFSNERASGLAMTLSVELELFSPLTPDGIKK